ncbi:capping protein inhibiting regulator of actin dynamics isoform X2 [Girardinichthys multiradiatus]|uniref:capping protein inhibiting regulator of actin dynamics isoform X2 n=1 Tax=Girardinichthys multiradiatus TaxID=208333 RepID=UPI001FADF8CD|nr:capping protein inhibiting regulator of actin dynamics isoform X2 [Girardinichthys multiradiatus]
MAMDATETNHDVLLEVTEPRGPERRQQRKFQPFRRLFGKKKKREAKRSFDGAELKASFSTGEVCSGVVSDNEESNKNLRDLNPIGSRALSHDSVFIPEGPLKELSLDYSMSQENVSDKRQIAQGIKFGQRPLSLRKSEGDEGSSDEEEVPRSPLKVLAQVEAEPPKMEPKVQGAQSSGQYSTPVKSPRSKRVLPPTGTIESINLDAVPQSVPRLDNTAAKHKLLVKPKNQRISRKHRRFTLDLQEVSIPGVMQEDMEAAGVFSDDQRRASLESSKESLKKQRLYEEDILEGRRRREMEEQKLREEAEERRRRGEEMRIRELEEERCRRRQQEEQEKRMREEAERRMKEEEDQMRAREEEDKWRQEEAERQRKEEDRRMKEEEERRKREEAERRKREEERKMREEAERTRREEEERKMREEAERMREEERRIREKEERRRRRQEEEEQIRKLEEERRKREEEDRRRLEEQKHREEEERKLEEEVAKKQQELEAEKCKKQKEEEEERKKKDEQKLRLREMEQEKQLALEEQMKMLTEEDAGSSDEQERKRRAEEQRWREMEERQRPFSFKVSSGEKQILFQKVNLTPVTPASSHQNAADADQREGATAYSLERQDPPNLPASSYVPHTAILVTGAQLCGTAVNLDQIKDTACKSLLGLGEERRAQGIPSAKSKSSPDHKSGKTKSLSESSFCPDRSSAAVLAEWASIRSKIFKGVEDGKYDEYPGPPSRNQPQISSEEQPSFSHTSLRKTMSASAKFSITPAKKKFGDSNRNSEVFNADNKDGKEEASQSDSPTPASQSPTFKPHTRTSKTVRIVERASEECMFAKDLPSFLVPSPGDISEGSEAKSHLQSKTEEGEEQGQDGEDNPSPFGIKLRRTNYSLRFHSEQSTEKRKKRYSAGDSFDGVPSPLTPIEPDSDTSSVFSDKSSPTSPQKEGVLSKYLHASASPAITRGKLGKPTSPIVHNEGEKVLSKPQLYRRPATSPKPSGATPTPPPSPLPKVAHVLPCEDVNQRTGSPDLSVQEQAGRSEELSTVAQLHRGNHSPVQGEEEPKEKRSFFPSINIPWREKADRKAELIRREKPSLQARLSLDSARVQEKEAGPLWITLALQKQKGFREQQQSREDRRSQREAKLAEKHARERDSVALVSPTECKESGCTSPSSKTQTPEEPKRPDSLLGRFERRDPLKKASTLPSSVTVEISDSTPSPPAVKDMSKRFPSSDSPQLSTEPAWLALAKRKAKAWSDCPQIIK